MRDLAGSADNVNRSALCLAELSCAFRRKVREGTLDPKAATRLADFFLDDLANERWRLVPVSDHILRQVELLTRSLPKSTPLRAGDAVHIVSAVQAGFHEIWTNDRHLLAATAHFGLQGRSVKP